MTEQLKLTDISFQAVQLAIRLRGITHQHPDATYTQHAGDNCGERTWGIDDLADHLSAINTVLWIIAETPNGYINREALDGLRDQFSPAVEFLATEWAQQVQKEADSTFLDGKPTPKQRRNRLQKAAPNLLAACKKALATMEAALEADDPQARTQIEWEAEPLASLRAAIAEAEAGVTG